MDRLAVSVAGALKAQPTHTAPSADRARIPKAAMLAYGRGLVLQDAGSHKEAIKAYREALELAPGFEAAKQRLAELEEGD